MNEIKVKGYYLDNEQMDAIKCHNKSVLVVAGAGCGKTITIIGKVKYLLYKGIKPSEILCISFTNETTNKLKNDLREESINEVNVYTFHKLALSIIENDYLISPSDYLEYIIDEYFEALIVNNDIVLKVLMNYFYLPKSKYLYKKIVIDSSELTVLKKIIHKFIMLMKTNSKDISYFINYLEEINQYNCLNKIQSKKLLYLCFVIYREYIIELTSSGMIDFEDMISLAIKTNDNKIPPYKYVIIDEFQDTSDLRCELIKKIIRVNNAYLFAVGDDFQSIYSFTGCDLNIFLHFNDYFNDATLKIISKTYRNSKELIDIAGRFIMKNSNLIKKDLISTKNINNPIIVVQYQYQKELINLIKRLAKENIDILILGRNNNDINDYLDNEVVMKDGQVKIPNIECNIKYLTIHRSKGLEAEVVIIINLENNINGLPNQVKESSVINLVANMENNYQYSEERRLFYVALTRTKTKVYLFCSKNNYSVFVKELLSDNKIKIKSV